LGVNLVIAKAFEKNNSSALNLVHFFFGLGAFFGPALVSIAIGMTDSGLIVHWAAAGLFAVLAGLTLLTRSSKSLSPIKTETRSDKRIKSVYSSPLIWVIGLMVLLYVGVEFGLGSWSTTFMNRTISMPIQSAALVTSAYWGFLTLGRLAGAIVSRKLSNLHQLGIALFGSAISGVAFAFLTGTNSPAIIALVMIGFFLGTILPTIVSVTSAAFTLHQGKAVGLVTALGSVGGLGIPWVSGLLLERVSTAGYTVFMAVILCILGLLFFLVRFFLKNKDNKEKTIGASVKNS
jgi:MFS transporter, FHS family, Na+ dependent glucose transporter 1